MGLRGEHERLRQIPRPKGGTNCLRTGRPRRVSTPHQSGGAGQKRADETTRPQGAQSGAILYPCRANAKLNRLNNTVFKYGPKLKIIAG